MSNIKVHFVVENDEELVFDFEQLNTAGGGEYVTVQFDGFDFYPLRIVADHPDTHMGWRYDCEDNLTIISIPLCHIKRSWSQERRRINRRRNAITESEGV